MPRTEPAGAREAWRADRGLLDRRRYELAHAVADRYPGVARVPGSVALTRAEWLPGAPVALDDVRLAWCDEPAPAAVTGTGPASVAVRAAAPDGAPYRTYAGALAALAPPRLLEDRFTYRLLAAPDAARLTYGPGTYLDGLNVGEAVAHETAAAARAGHDPVTTALPLRAAVGDPTDPHRRPMTTALTVLTLRHDRATGAMSFPLHHRDAAAVAHGGGLVQVAPVGVFQPTVEAAEDAAARRAGLDLWRCTVREYAEELLGAPEEYPEPFDYDHWPPYRALTGARADGRLRPYLLGIAVDPLTLATDLLAVTVIDAAAHDRVFADTVRANPEGTLTGHVPFTPASVRDLLATARLQPAAAAVLTLAGRHRRRLAR